MRDKTESTKKAKMKDNRQNLALNNKVEIPCSILAGELSILEEFCSLFQFIHQNSGAEIRSGSSAF